jgi:hypothetical protein
MLFKCKIENENIRHNGQNKAIPPTFLPLLLTICVARPVYMSVGDGNSKIIGIFLLLKMMEMEMTS